MPRKPLAPPPYRTPFLDWDSKRLATIDGRQSFYKQGIAGKANGQGSQGSGGTLISHPWLIWLNDLILYVTDRGNLASIQSGVLADLPTGFGPDDANREFYYVTNYDHLLRWTGSAWSCIDYNVGVVSGHIFAPTTAGWILCDGDGVATTQCMLPDGSLSPPFLIPNCLGSYLKFGAYGGALPDEATAPSLTGIPGGTVTGGGSISGTAYMPDHEHTFFYEGSTDSNSSGHVHSFEAGVALVYSSAFVGVIEGGSVEVVVPEITGDTAGLTDDESSPHDHGISISGSTSGVVDGPIAIDVSGLSVTLDEIVFTGAIGTLEVEDDGEPRHNTLLPYLRL